ncbi:hypothetical protein C4K08_3947 [Pseudomonas chlororaphis subsp. aureofaciens]|nr:hypothetical protein C4K08_3947 [Pseudomonas chlororaphis subsp. aureofaciens]
MELYKTVPSGTLGSKDSDGVTDKVTVRVPTLTPLISTMQLACAFKQKNEKTSAKIPGKFFQKY